MDFNRQPDKETKLKNGVVLRHYKELTEDKGGLVETWIAVEEATGRELVKITKKDDVVLTTESSRDAQDSGLFEQIAKKAGLKENDINYTDPTLNIAKGGVLEKEARSKKENGSSSHDSEKAKLVKSDENDRRDTVKIEGIDLGTEAQQSKSAAMKLMGLVKKFTSGERPMTGPAGPIDIKPALKKAEKLQKPSPNAAVNSIQNAFGGASAPSVPAPPTQDTSGGLGGMITRGIQSLGKDDKAHAPGSPKDSAHDVAEGASLKTEIGQQRGPGVTKMLTHLRARKQQGSSWDRSPSNMATGLDPQKKKLNKAVIDLKTRKKVGESGQDLQAPKAPKDPKSPDTRSRDRKIRDALSAQGAKGSPYATNRKDGGGTQGVIKQPPRSDFHERIRNSLENINKKMVAEKAKSGKKLDKAGYPSVSPTKQGPHGDILGPMPEIGLDFGVARQWDAQAEQLERQAEQAHSSRYNKGGMLQKAKPDWAHVVHSAGATPQEEPADKTAALKDFKSKWDSAMTDGPDYLGGQSYDLLTDGESNPKIAKGMYDEDGNNKGDYHAAVLHMSPSNVAGVGQMCAAAGTCTLSCLNTSGQGGAFSTSDLNSSQKARLGRTKLFAQHPDEFWTVLHNDIRRHIDMAKKDGRKPALRLNGTSDVFWENIRPKELGGQNIFEAYPDVQFWDYTKHPDRLVNNKHSNYNLTFSLDEKNEPMARRLLSKGYNVAAVLGGIPTKHGKRKPGALPAMFKIGDDHFKVLDGDETDFRFLDPHGAHNGGKGHVIALRAKADAAYDYSGFVKWNHDAVEHKYMQKIMAKLGFDPRDPEATKTARAQANAVLRQKFQVLKETMQTPKGQELMGNRTKQFVKLASKIRAFREKKKEKLGKTLSKAKKTVPPGETGGQHIVDLGIPPTAEKKDGYKMWHVNKEQLGGIIKNWDKVGWDWASHNRAKSGDEGHHSTVISRKSMAVPVRDFYAKNKGARHERVLYHGVGKDTPSLQEMARHSKDTVAYDPYHPDPKVRQSPKGKFDMIHSHYTLNVVDKNIGLDILKHIHGLLSNNGHAAISVRNDKTLLDKFAQISSKMPTRKAKKLTKNSEMMGPPAPPPAPMLPQEPDTPEEDLRVIPPEVVS